MREIIEKELYALQNWRIKDAQQEFKRELEAMRYDINSDDLHRISDWIIHSADRVQKSALKLIELKEQEHKYLYWLKQEEHGNDNGKDK